MEQGKGKPSFLEKLSLNWDRFKQDLKEYIKEVEAREELKQKQKQLKQEEKLLRKQRRIDEKISRYLITKENGAVVLICEDGYILAKDGRLHIHTHRFSRTVNYWSDIDILGPELFEPGYIKVAGMKLRISNKYQWYAAERFRDYIYDI